jgi:hypothetical protein
VNENTKDPMQVEAAREQVDALIRASGGPSRA